MSYQAKRYQGRNFPNGVYELSQVFDPYAQRKEVDSLALDLKKANMLVRIIKDDYGRTWVYFRPKSSPLCSNCGEQMIVCGTVSSFGGSFTHYCKACKYEIKWNEAQDAQAR